MITLLLGHRGCGKSDLLRRITGYLPDTMTVDLDKVIAASQGRSIEEIFARDGEERFRELEREALDQVLAQGPEPMVVALGAGFTGTIPDKANCLWVRRETDRDGRIFLDRPRLNSQVDPLTEYGERFARREDSYRCRSAQVLTLGEGFLGPRAEECDFFTGKLSDLGGALTLLPENFNAWSTWSKSRLAWGVDLFEVRDDLLTSRQCQQALTTLPAEKILYSFRKSGELSPPTGVRTDWPLELGPCPFARPDILSLHQRREGESIRATAARLTTAGQDAALMKLALPTASFAELREGDEWAGEEPGRRVFLPISPDGRWAWYRHRARGKTPLNFFREGAGSAPDQPLLLDWAGPAFSGGDFAAVLGDPVQHSWTPAVHADWFGAKKMPVYAIRVTEEEWEQGALDELRRYGLRAAAVTAPLKVLAHAAASVRDDIASRLGVVNTLWWDQAGSEWRGANTDQPGLAKVVATLDHAGDIAVWGGGGTLPVLQTLFPDATFYAARTGLPRVGGELAAPALLVWATGRPGTWPPDHWRPTLVLDLSYRENSPGREYAQRIGATYTSGVGMFMEQARLQQVFWGQNN